MELQIHDVESLSLTGEDVEGDDPYKVIRIKINGWKNVITLYCKDDIICDSKGLGLHAGTLIPEEVS